MTFKQKWGALLALAGVSTGAAAETPLTEANLEQLNAKAQEQADQLVKANELVATLTSERDTARTEFSAKETELATATESLTKATESLTAANDKVTALEAQVKVYGSQPGAVPTNPVKPNALEGPEAAKNPHVNPNAAHNQYAASLFGN
jgi:septal ring factor EnvC (AmiA/AmiB activator)